MNSYSNLLLPSSILFYGVLAFLLLLSSAPAPAPAILCSCLLLLSSAPACSCYPPAAPDPYFKKYIKINNKVS